MPFLLWTSMKIYVLVVPTVQHLWASLDFVAYPEFFFKEFVLKTEHSMTPETCCPQQSFHSHNIVCL